MRENSTISIYRPGSQDAIQTVPITMSSKRVWKLMEEDSITLSFDLAVSVDFQVGDYIDDDVFGHFTISEDPLPADYDPSTGAYKYTLRFDADWIGWKNKIFMLPYNGVRKETTWDLTDTLAGHLEVVIQNLYDLGYTKTVNNQTVCEYSYDIDTDTIDDPTKAVHVTYSGTTILDALKTLADAYQTEFWVVGGVIHFGKCEVGSTPIPFSMTPDDGRTINVENMVPTRNDSEYGNRFYVYGSTKNLPETYRKHLSFKVDHCTGNPISFGDSTRKVFKDMLVPQIVDTPQPQPTTYSGEWKSEGYVDEDYDEVIEGQTVTFHYAAAQFATDVIPAVAGCKVAIDIPTIFWDWHYTWYIYSSNGTKLTEGTSDLSEYVIADPVGETVTGIIVKYSYEYESSYAETPPGAPTVQVTNTKEFGYYATLSCVINGQTHTATVRLENTDTFFFVQTMPYTYYNVSPITGFGVGTEFTLNFSNGTPGGLNVSKVPFSYYTPDEDIDEARISGERRLMLPVDPAHSSDDEVAAIAADIEHGYVQRGTITKDELVERVIFFDEIYPRCALRVTHVDESAYDNDTTYSDGSKKIQNLPAYTLQAARIDGANNRDFPFDPKTMMVVGKLTATFLTPDETKSYSEQDNENACSLMGMTFDVACNRANGITTYQLAWNEDYGEKLPNEVLKPKVGDAFILAGWNPAAMATLGLIESAENELAKISDEYAELVKEAQFTFDCSMMSDWVLARCTLDNGVYLPDGLLPMGQKVTIHHASLSQDFTSRIIGFEYKLDIPYDTPVYTVGETEAYSRMREIEKSLHAQLQSTSSSSNTSSSSLSGGGSSQSSGGGSPLHLTIGTMDGLTSVDYDGSEEKSFRVPSVVDHLVDSGKVPRIGETTGGVTKLVDNEGNELQIGSFFEAHTDPSDNTKQYIQLKSQYTGLSALGWIADGGVGPNGGGGGGSSTLEGLNDVSISSRADGDVLTYNFGTNHWVNTSKASFLSNYYTKAQVDSLIPSAQIQSDWNQTNNSALDYIKNKPSLATVATSGSYNDLTNKPTSLKNPYALTFGSKTYDGSVAKEITASDLGALTFHQTIYTLTLQAGAFTAGSYTPNSAAATVNIPTTLDHIGDGTNKKFSDFVHIAGAETITGAKTFSAQLTASNGISLTGDIVPSSDLGPSLGYSNRRFANINARTYSAREINFNLSSDASKKSGYLGFGDGWMTLRTSASGIDASDASTYKQITFHQSYGFYPQGTGVNLGYSSARWANIYGVNGNLSGDLSVAGNATVTTSLRIGSSYTDDNQYIEYDTTNNAFHIVGNLYADGWISDGGIGSGGGGGSSTLYGLLDVSLPQPPSTPTADDVLTYNSTSGKWTNVSKSTFLSGYALSSSLATVATSGSYNDLLNTPTIPTVPTNVSAFTNDAGYLTYHQTIYALTVSAASSQHAITGSLTYTPNSGAQTLYVPTSLDNLPDGSTRKLSDYVTLSGTQNITGEKTFINSISGKFDASDPNPSWVIDNDGSAVFDTLQVGGSGVVTLAGAQTITGAKTFSDHIKLVNKRITFRDSGNTTDYASIQGGNGYLQMNIGNGTYYMYPTSGFFLSGGGAPCGLSNHRWSSVYSVDANLSGVLRLCASNGDEYGEIQAPGGYVALRTREDTAHNFKQITFHERYGFYPETNGIDLGYNSASHRWANIYGVNANISGNLDLAATSHIDIGPLRIEYDSTNNALHITRVDNNDNTEYGIYADGFVADGGIPQTS